MCASRVSLCVAWYPLSGRCCVVCSSPGARGWVLSGGESHADHAALMPPLGRGCMWCYHIFGRYVQYVQVESVLCLGVVVARVSQAVVL